MDSYNQNFTFIEPKAVKFELWMFIELNLISLIPWLQLNIDKPTTVSNIDACDKITVWLIAEMLTLLMLWTFESTKYDLQILTKHEYNCWLWSCLHIWYLRIWYCHKTTRHCLVLPLRWTHKIVISWNIRNTKLVCIQSRRINRNERWSARFVCKIT